MSKGSRIEDELLKFVKIYYALRSLNRIALFVFNN